MISVQNLIIFSLFVQFLNCVEINDHHELKIHQNEMSTSMTATIVAHSSSVLDKISDNEKASESIKVFMEQEFNGTWLVMVGENFTSSNKIPHLNGTYINFSYKERTVIALQLKLSDNGCTSIEDLIKNARKSDVKVIYNGGFNIDTHIVLTKETIATASSMIEIASELKKKCNDKWANADLIVNAGMKNYFGYSEMRKNEGELNNYFLLLEIGEILVKFEGIQKSSNNFQQKNAQKQFN